MWSVLLSIAIGLLLVIHGFAHWNLPTNWGKSSTEHSWLLSRSGSGVGAIHTLATVLWSVTLLIFLLAGVALFAHLSWWRELAVAASVLSLVMILLFWRTNLIVGALVDVGVIVALLWLNWPSANVLWA